MRLKNIDSSSGQLRTLPTTSSKHLHLSEPDSQALEGLRKAPKFLSMTYGDLQTALQHFPTAALGESEQIIIQNQSFHFGRRTEAKKAAHPRQTVQICPDRARFEKKRLINEAPRRQTPTSGHADATRTWYLKVRFASTICLPDASCVLLRAFHLEKVLIWICQQPMRFQRNTAHYSLVKRRQVFVLVTSWSHGLSSLEGTVPGHPIAKEYTSSKIDNVPSWFS